MRPHPSGGRCSPISIHALRVEGDNALNATSKKDARFLSTPSGWRATANPVGCYSVSHISIHALRVEGDVLLLTGLWTSMDFYPRPPGGGRHCARSLAHDLPHFYPRPPGGGRRRCWIETTMFSLYFYPRPPGGGRLRVRKPAVAHISISIHALRVEGDFRIMV